MRRSVVVHERDRIAVEVATHPLEITVRRDGRRLLGPIAPRVRDGEVGDQFIQLTESVIAREELEDPLTITDARAAGDGLEIEFEDGTRAALAITLEHEVVLELSVPPGPAGVRRIGLSWPGHAEQRLTGLGARHGLHVVWVTPWVNLDSSEGQRPPGAESARLHRRPAASYDAGRPHFVKDAGGEPFVSRWWMDTGSPIDFTAPSAERWWREQAKRVLALGVQGVKADDGEGFYYPPGVTFADGRTGAQAAWAQGILYRRSMQRALDEIHPGEGVVFERPGWTGQQSVGVTWGGDQASDFWSLRALVAATLTAAGSGFSNWSHDVGGYLGERLVARCPKELLVRWVQFGCFTPLMQAHGRFEQEAWAYDAGTLDLYREYVLLHERLVPYVRAAAATAARCGLPIIRPLLLTDPGDPRGWAIADASGYGPSLWVAPVVEAGATEREVDLPRGDWIDFWTGAELAGGGELVADARSPGSPTARRCGGRTASGRRPAR